MNTNRLTASLALVAFAATVFTGATTAHAEELDDLLQLKASTIHTYSPASMNRTSQDPEEIVQRMERLLGSDMTMNRAPEGVGKALGLNENPLGFGYTPVVSAKVQSPNTGTYGDVTTTVTAPGTHRAGRTATYRVSTTPGLPGTVVFVLVRTNASGSESVVKRSTKLLDSQGKAAARMKVGKKVQPGAYRVYALVNHDEFMYDFIVSDTTKVKR